MFAYCNNNPVIFTDQCGNAAVEIENTFEGTTISKKEKHSSVVGTITVIVSLEVRIIDGQTLVTPDYELSITSTGVAIALPDGRTFSFDYDSTGIKPTSHTKLLLKENTSEINFVASLDGLGISLLTSSQNYSMEFKMLYQPSIFTKFIEKIAAIVPPAGGAPCGSPLTGNISLTNTTLMFR